MGQLSEFFGREVRSLRRERGISQAQLSEAVGTSEAWISRIERGGARAPSFDTIEAIAHALGVSVSRLFAGNGPTDDARYERLVAAAEKMDDEQLQWLEQAADLARRSPR